jgi:hypothetical protein
MRVPQWISLPLIPHLTSTIKMGLSLDTKTHLQRFPQYPCHMWRNQPNTRHLKPPQINSAIYEPRQTTTIAATIISETIHASLSTIAAADAALSCQDAFQVVEG